MKRNNKIPVRKSRSLYRFKRAAGQDAQPTTQTVDTDPTSVTIATTTH